MNQKIVIVGATSAIAEYCVRIWVAESPKNIVLLGRNQERVDRVARDLRVRSLKSTILVNIVDFEDSEKIQTSVDEVCISGVPDIVLIAHGSLPDQNECQKNLETNKQAIELNGISPILFAEAFATHMERANKGSLAIIGSVAGDRGRKSNYVYGSAKGLVTRYAQGLQHRLAGTNVKVTLIKPGPTDTPMTSMLKIKGVALAPVDQVAKKIVKGIASGKYVVYAPKKWEIIMMLIRHLPRFIFNKMEI